jgi:hypothetical protein
MLSIILGWLGGGPLSTIANALTKAHSDSLNAKTVQEKQAADERVATLAMAYSDTANARQSAKGLPTWMAVIGFMIGIGFAVHLFFITLATTFQPLIVGGWFDWTLHIPKLPAPLDVSEVGVIAFFFGAAAVIGGAGSIAGAIAKRKGT